MINRRACSDRGLACVSRIAMYIWYYLPIGGAEEQCKRLSEELVKKGVSLFIVTEFAGDVKRYKTINGIRIYCLDGFMWLRRAPLRIKRLFCKNRDGEKKPGAMTMPFSKLFTYDLPNYLFFISSLWLLFLKRHDFDIIHVHGAHWVGGFGVRIARLLNKTVVVKESSCGDYMTFDMQSLRSKKKTMQADLFIAVSDKAILDLASAGIPKVKIRKIPNGVNINDDKWQLDLSKEQVVICTSNLTQPRIKGLDILIHAWGILMKRYDRKVHLQMFGEGDPSLLTRLAMALGVGDHVHFLGFTDDVKNRLLGSYLFVLPSRTEGLSNSLLEAMSLGVPCVATDIPGNRDLVQSGINGLLAPTENPQALAEAIAFMLNSPEEATRMGRNARKTIENEYTMSRIASKYVNLYQELINEPVSRLQ